jgi:acetylornithine/succinyldiaminopimelate/putrescine aminotransferase
MNQKVPGDFAKKTLLVTTGSEAVENAVKSPARQPGAAAPSPSPAPITAVPITPCR